MRRMMRCRSDERGVTIAFLALLITVLVAMAALVVDVGALQAEKRELQNGADAGALALAQKCATGPGLTACYPDEMAQATGLAGSNANDGLSNVDSVTHGIHPTTGTNTVTVVTSTADSAGTILPYYFAQVITGNLGQTVHASATAAWGPLAEGFIPSLAMSYCDWWFLTDQGTVYTYDTPVQYDYRANITDCTGEVGYPAGVEPRGGFTWLGDGSQCWVKVQVGSYYRAYDDPGFDPPPACNLLPMVGKRIMVAIYDARDDSVSPRRFRVAGFAAVEITRYRFPPGQIHANNGQACGASPGAAGHCIDAEYRELKGVPGPPGGGTNFGVTSVSLIA